MAKPIPPRHVGERCVGSSRPLPSAEIAPSSAPKATLAEMLLRTFEDVVVVVHVVRARNAAGMRKAIDWGCPTRLAALVSQPGCVLCHRGTASPGGRAGRPETAVVVLRATTCDAGGGA